MVTIIACSTTWLEECEFEEERVARGFMILQLPRGVCFEKGQMNWILRI